MSGEPRFLMEDLNGPNAPSMGPDGRIYFPQVFANEIWVYDLDAGRGQLLFDDLSVPTAVKFDSRGRIVVSESGAGQITAIDVQTGRRETLAEVPEGHRQRLGRGRRPHLRVALRERARRRGDGQPAPDPLGAGPPRSPRPGPRRPTVTCCWPTGSASPSVNAAGDIERLLTLLIELHTLAIGVSPLGDDLAVLAITGEILLYRSGSTEPVVLVERPRGAHGDRWPMAPTACWWWSAGAARILRIDADGHTDTVATGHRRPDGGGPRRRGLTVREPERHRRGP